MKTLKKLILFILILGANSALADTDWELAKEEDGIKVYTREVDGWDVEEFKVIAVFDVKRYLIYNVLIDVANYASWYPDLVEAVVCKRISETEFYSYSKLDLPWPTDDRIGESHMKVTHNKENKTTIIEMNTVTHCNPDAEGYTRMTKGKGFWKLTSKGEGTVVHFQFLSDPGGSIPSWVINMFIVDNPFNTIKALKSKVGG
jgi:START domain